MRKPQEPLKKASLRFHAHEFLSTVFREDDAGRLLYRAAIAHGWRIGLFGGALRDLMWSRAKLTPRDIDLVVQCGRAGDVQELLREFAVRNTRFGGLKARTRLWSYDVWKLETTWAFRHFHRRPDFRLLPRTTFLNVEAAVAVFDGGNQSFRLYHNERFGTGFKHRVVDINLESNPFPQLCVIRSLFTAAKLRFNLSSRLRHYIANHGSAMTMNEIDEVMSSHYGRTIYTPAVIMDWIASVADSLNTRSPTLPFSPDRLQRRAIWQRDSAAI